MKNAREKSKQVIIMESKSKLVFKCKNEKDTTSKNDSRNLKEKVLNKENLKLNIYKSSANRQDTRSRSVY